MNAGPHAPQPTLLLVEDNPDDVLLVRRALRKAAVGAALAVAIDGDEAVAYLAGDGAYADRALHPWPALVLLDWKLPKRGGLEVLAWIRGRPPLATLPVVVLTSSREDEDVRQAYEGGANSYLQKPVAAENLVRLLEVVGLYWLRTNVVPGSG